MWNPPTKRQLEKIPKLYSQEKSEDPKVYMKFFMGSWTWYVLEFDGNDTFFGYIVDDSNLQGAELGYFSLKELLTLRSGFMQVDRELHGISVYSPKKLSEVKKLHKSERGY
jgi:hypothetical protein